MKADKTMCEIKILVGASWPSNCASVFDHFVGLAL